MEVLNFTLRMVQQPVSFIKINCIIIIIKSSNFVHYSTGQYTIQKLKGHDHVCEHVRFSGYFPRIL